MNRQKVRPSTSFQRMAIRSVLSIVLFVITYLILIGLAVALTVLCGYAGLMLIMFKPMIITLIIGVGMMSIGFLVLVFLFKFLFKKHKVDRSDFLEITREQDPKLYEFIRGIVNNVDTRFPRKIFLSAEVNASVFYDSGFWSMFLPVRKNLMIGVGLASSVSVSEFSAILAHEFGHFSQRSMKVGSYVFNVNKIIFNLLYENESYSELANSWSSLHQYLSLFVLLSFKIVTGIQIVLRKVYGIVNINYLSLSREMEFHADEIAANAIGSKPLVSALLRLSLADHSYNTVLNYYGEKVQQSVKTDNLFDQQLFVMNYIARKSNLPVENGLPQLVPDQLTRYNKSKLVISDQWASHPSTGERVARLEKLGFDSEIPDNRLASNIFTDFIACQKRITEHVFSFVKFKETPTLLSKQQFFNDFSGQLVDNSFDEIYNCYYDNKNPPLLDFEKLPVDDHKRLLSEDELLANEYIDKVYTLISLENDLNLIQQINKGNYSVKSFDYDGIKYFPTDCGDLILKIEEELKITGEVIYNHDVDIQWYLKQKAIGCEKEDEYAIKYKEFFQAEKEYERKNTLYNKMAKATAFIYQTTPYDAILNNLEQLSILEVEFKREIKGELNSMITKELIADEMKANFDKYLLGNLIYFNMPHYENDSVTVLMKSISDFQNIMLKTFFNAKKNLLNYQVLFLN